MRIVEFRIILPMTVEEYQIAQLYSVAQASKNETGGGEGVEVVKNEPFTATVNPPNEALLEGVPVEGQYTQKWYHLASRMPSFLRMLAPKGSTDIREDAWNAYPYCRTIISNPGYMKDKFFVRIESMHVNDAGTSDNVHRLNAQQLAKRDVVYIDIADNSVVSKDDYKAEWDPSKYHSNKTGRGPLVGPEWQKRSTPVMCCYKLVTCQFKWFMLQGRVEHIIMKSERRLFNNFHRQLFCWMDDWFGLSIADIRRIEEETQAELEKERNKGEIRGTRADADDDKDK